MPLLSGRPARDLREEDLLTLIGTASEGRVIDFKRDPIGTSDDAKREFLADVSSFANTVGGHVVIGMDEDEGIASNLLGIDVPDVDAETLRLENILRDGLDPRLPYVSIERIPLASGRVSLVVDIGHSWLAPHMVTFRHHSRFYARNSAGKFPMDTTEIRLAILGGETRVEEARAFHRERVAAISRNVVEGVDLAAPVSGIVLHVIPVGAFDVGARVDINETIYNHPDLRPLHSPTPYLRGRYNLDGIFVDDTAFRQQGQGARHYLQLFRRGIMETFDSRLLHSRGDTILGYPVERTLIDDSRRFLGLMETLGTTPPILILVTVLGTQGRVILTPGDRYEPEHSVDRGTLPLPEIVVNGFDVDTSQALRPMFDALWQAGGYPRSPNYDADGVWQRRAE